jgi:hypothetical protein
MQPLPGPAQWSVGSIDEEGTLYVAVRVGSLIVLTGIEPLEACPLRQPAATSTTAIETPAPNVRTERSYALALRFGSDRRDGGLAMAVDRAEVQHPPQLLGWL